MLDSILVVGLILVQDCPPPGERRIHTEVHVFISEEFDEEWDHEHYQQAWPVVHSLERDGPQGKTSGRISYFTACRFRTEDPEPRLTPPSPSLGASLGGTCTWRRIDVPRKMVTVVTGLPRSDPPVTKSGFSPEGPGAVRDSDRPVLYGPDLNLVLSRDVSEWGPARWLPESTALHLYGRALFGRFEVYGIDSDLEHYSAGLRLAVPLFERPPFALGAEASSGPGLMRTDLGDAAGVESGVGMHAVVSLGGGLSLRCAASASLFVSEDLFSWGPGAHVGFDLSW